MKIKTKDLMDAVTICSSVKNNTSLPLWDSLLFQCLYGDITITGRSNKNIISHRLKAEDESSCEAFLFNGATILNLLKECPDDVITLDRTDDGFSISFSHSTFAFNGRRATDSMDYINTLPLYGGEKAAMVIPAHLIKDHPKVWDTFSSTDELREIMQFICIEALDGGGDIVITNAHLLFQLRFEWYTDEPQTFFLPSRMVSKLCKFMPKTTLHIKRYEKNWAALLFGNTSLLYLCPDAKYPNWRAVVPVNPHQMIFNTKELVGAVKQVHSVCNSSTHQIILEAGKNFTIHTHNFDDDQTGKVGLKDAVKEGDDIKIGFNSVLLQQALGSISGNEVTMTYTTPNRAVVFKGNANKDTLALLMPVMIND